MDVEVVSEGETHCFAGAANVLVSLYWAAPTAEALQERVPWVERTIEEYGKIGLLVVVSADATGGLPGRDFRAESRTQAQRYEDHVLFSASVIEGKAILDSLVRTFMRGLAVVAARNIEVRFFEDAAPAIVWASEKAAPHRGPSEEDLTVALAALRRRRMHPPLVP